MTVVYILSAIVFIVFIWVIVKIGLWIYRRVTGREPGRKNMGFHDSELGLAEKCSLEYYDSMRRVFSMVKSIQYFNEECVPTFEKLEDQFTIFIICRVTH